MQLILRTVVIFTALWLVHGWTLQTPVYFLFAGALILGTFVDFDHLILPDRVTLGGMAAGLVLSAAVPALQGQAARRPAPGWCTRGWFWCACSVPCG